jgi:hypothetical protein
MMMVFAGHFIPGRFAGNLDGRQPLVLDEGVDISIYGREAKRSDSFLRKSQRFVWRKWSVRFEES